MHHCLVFWLGIFSSILLQTWTITLKTCEQSSTCPAIYYTAHGSKTTTSVSYIYFGYDACNSVYDHCSSTCTIIQCERSSCNIGQSSFLLTNLISTIRSMLTLKDLFLLIFGGHDVYAMISQQQYLFWLNMGETPESLVYCCSSSCFSSFSMWPTWSTYRKIWIKYGQQNLTGISMASKIRPPRQLTILFDVGPQTVQALIFQGILVLWRHFRQNVTWPSIREWHGMRNVWREFPDALGSIDVTPHEIRIPSNKPQRKFYSGHQHYHLLNRQLIIDSQCDIRFLQAGFLGSRHNAQTFRLMDWFLKIVCIFFSFKDFFYFRMSIRT